MAQQYTPEIREEIRDAEWRVERSTDGGCLWSCHGLSKIRYGHNAPFLTQRNRNVQTLDPISAELVEPFSSRYRTARLLIDTSLRLTPPVDKQFRLGIRQQ